MLKPNRRCLFISVEETIQELSKLANPDRDNNGPKTRTLKRIYKGLTKLTKAGASPLKATKQKLDRRHEELQSQMDLLAVRTSVCMQFVVLINYTKRTTRMRSPKRELGPYRILAAVEKLVSVSCRNAFELKGRYEETGLSMFDLVTELTTIGNAVVVRIYSLRCYVY